MSASTSPPLSAYVVADRYGAVGPMLVEISPANDAISESPVAPSTINAINTLSEALGTEGFLSFFIDEHYMQFMEARARFVLESFFEEERALLLVRCSSLAAAREFMNKAQATHHIKAYRRGARTGAAPLSNIAAIEGVSAHG